MFDFRFSIVLWIVLLLSTLFISSCTPKIHFTLGLKEKISSAGIPMSRIQFYNDKTIELNKVEPNQDVSVEKGKIKIQNKGDVNSVSVKEETRGECLRENGNILGIGFDSKSTDYIEFIPMDDTDEGAHYVVNAFFENKGYSTVTYAKKEYYVVPGGEFVQLLVKKKQIDKMISNSKSPKGRKVR